MSKTKQPSEWNHYFAHELERALKILSELGFTIEKDRQVHIKGERFLMSGKKLVLIGKADESGDKVIIKVSSDADGIREIERERLCRKTLNRLAFAGTTFLSPKELLHTTQKGLVISVNEYIAQERPFLTRSLEEQFTLALSAFKMQESVHAATYAHAQVIKKIFGIWNAEDYLRTALQFKEGVMEHAPTQRELLESAYAALTSHETDIERYTGFLTHEDFALHNLRIKDNDIYLIDYSSLRFGNKHESWARFMNFMLLYNRELERALMTYLNDNRAPEECHSVQLMRMYKTMQLLEYHSNAAETATGTVSELSRRRVTFWSDVLASLLDGKDVGDEIIKSYKKDRDALRSDEEKERQRELQQL